MSDNNTATGPAELDKSAAGHADHAVVEFDWQSPQRFTQSQLDGLEVFAKLACRRLSQAFTSMFRADVQVLPGPLTQYFGFRLLQESIERPEYWMSIQSAGSNRRVGYVAFAKENAGRWVASLLGAMATDVSAGQTLSSLEQELLQDITTGMVQTFSDVLERACGLRIEAAGVEKLGELDFQESQEMDAFCKLTLASPGENSLAASLVISSDFLGAVVGLAPPARPDPGGRQAIQRHLLAHLQSVPVLGHARLGQGAVTMRDMMTIEPGDVILLDRRHDDPIDFLIKDKHIFSGYPCIAGMRYGLQIVADQGQPIPQTNSAAEQIRAE